MRRLAWLAALATARAAPDVDTLLARGAPEARGKCLEGTCALLSEKTHVYDVANRPWLLPYIADRATGGDRAFLVALIRHASAEDPDDRPSFAELVGAIDRRVNDGATVN